MTDERMSDTPRTDHASLHTDAFDSPKKARAFAGQLEMEIADLEREAAGLRAILDTIGFHLRRNDHVGPDGYRCTMQILDRITKALAGEAGKDGETP